MLNGLPNAERNRHRRGGVTARIARQNDTRTILTSFHAKRSKAYMSTLSIRLISMFIVLAVVFAIGNTSRDASAQSPDTTAPTFVSAEVDTSGTLLTITFSEPVVVNPFVKMLSDLVGYDVHFFIRAVIHATVDGREEVFLFKDHAVISGKEIRIGLSTPPVTPGQEVLVSYSNVYATNAGNLLQDVSGNAVPFFSSQPVTNRSTSTSSVTVPEGPTFSVSTITADEGDTETFDLTLASEPSGEETVYLFYEPFRDGTIRPATMTFDADNWNQPQTATLTLEEDTDSFDAWGVIMGWTGTLTANPQRRATITRVIVVDQDAALAVSSDSGSSVTTFAENGSGFLESFSVPNPPSLRWAIYGPDSSAFTINRSGHLPDREGNLSFASSPDFEDPSDENGDNIYELIIPAVSASGATGYLPVAVRVTDASEPTGAPDAPSVSAATGTINSLDISWNAPGNSGRPAISGYDLRYIRSDSSDKADSNWTDGPQSQTGTSAAITGLANGTSYDVQVRAVNSDGDGAWSSSGVGSTNAGNKQPSFTERAPTRSVPENTASASNVGSPVTASDPEGDSLIYSLEGDDAADFDIVASTDQVLTKTALDYETKSTYSLTVAVHDGKDEAGNADTSADTRVDLTINVSNENEQGTVMLSASQPQVGAALTASLSDPDGQLSAITWTWEASASRSDWNTLGGATSSSDTPSASELGQYLRATASYTDGHGVGKSALSISDNPVRTVPAAPKIASVTPSDEALTLEWTAPTSSGGASIASYDARYIRSDAPGGR